MKILHIANGDDKMGSGKCLFELLSYEINSGNILPILINPYQNKMNDWCDEYGIENYSISYPVFMYPYHDMMARLKYIVRKKQYFKSRKLALKKLEEKLDLNSIDIIHTNNCLYDFGRLIAQKYNKPLVWHLREGGLTQHNLHPFIKNFSSHMNEYTTAFIAVSEAVKKEWIDLGLNEEKINVIHDGVKIPKMLRKKKEKNGKIRFVITGTISEVKGQIQIIKAIKKLPDTIKDIVELDIWGGGEEKYLKYIVNEIKKWNLENIVHLKGFTDNVWDILSEYDVGFNCTRMEAFGRTTVEYLISGMPVIASNMGSNLEIINKSNGILYEYGNIDDLTQKIIDMVNLLHKFNSEKIILDAISEYDCDICNRKILEIFEECLD